MTCIGRRRPSRAVWEVCQHVSSLRQADDDGLTTSCYQQLCHQHSWVHERFVTAWLMVCTGRQPGVVACTAT
jgi:hypothetical protein